MLVAVNVLVFVCLFNGKGLRAHAQAHVNIEAWDEQRIFILKIERYISIAPILIKRRKTAFEITPGLIGRFAEPVGDGIGKMTGANRQEKNHMLLFIMNHSFVSFCFTCHPSMKVNARGY